MTQALGRPAASPGAGRPWVATAAGLEVQRRQERWV
jgi:hypothetical protein